MVFDPITKICSVRPVVPGGAGDAMATPDFVTSVKPISTNGADYTPISLLAPHGFFRPSYGPEREWQAYDEDVLKGL